MTLEVSAVSNNTTLVTGKKKAGLPIAYDPALQPRIEARVEKLPDAPGCWLWTGPLAKTGYPMNISIGNRGRRAQRVAYAAFRGDVPARCHTDHLCNVRSCVNPWHLEITTSRENTRRGRNQVAAFMVATHCQAGHEYTSENTYVWVEKDGSKHRHCRACAREATHRYYLANPEKFREQWRRQNKARWAAKKENS